MNAQLIEKNGSKLSGTPKLAKLVADAFASGQTLPATIKKVNEKSGENTINVVSPLYWAKVAESLGPLAATAPAVKSARKSGQRREVVALRANISVTEVVKLETSRGAKPVYTGKGTKKHLAI